MFFLKIEKQEPILLPPQPTRKELAEIRKHNLEVRSEVYRAVRRPGRGMYFLLLYFRIYLVTMSVLMSMTNILFF